jgi:uncharacterized FAD-dependent dehydrogenase
MQGLCVLENWYQMPWCSVLQPHLGTDRLIGILRAFRAQLLALGVQIRWGTAVHSLDITAQGSIAGVHLEGVFPRHLTRGHVRWSD